MYFYCYVYVFLLLCLSHSVYSGSLCCFVYCLCVNVYCTVLYYCHWMSTQLQLTNIKIITFYISGALKFKCPHSPPQPAKPKFKKLLYFVCMCMFVCVCVCVFQDCKTAGSYEFCKIISFMLPSIFQHAQN
jgi:hypothetical protein